MTQNLNQFKPTSEKGMLDLAINVNLFDCRIDPASVADLTNINAAGFKVVNVPGELIMVDLVTDNTDPDIFGFLPYEVKSNSYVAGDLIRLASSHSVIRMEASAAIARYADLEITVAGTKVATKTTGTTIGKALDIAAADGDLIRVFIKTI
jgi:hypothetical protein